MKTLNNIVFKTLLCVKEAFCIIFRNTYSAEKRLHTRCMFSFNKLLKNLSMMIKQIIPLCKIPASYHQKHFSVSTGNI